MPDGTTLDAAAPTVTWEEHGPPIVGILGASLQRAARQPKVAEQMRALRGTVALRSTADPQAATLHFGDGAVHVTHGVAPDADIVIRADLNTMGRPGSPKPKVSGAVRHPRLALGVARVLDAPTPGGWSAAVDELWAWARGQPGRPEMLRVVCTDDARQHTLGQPGGSSIEVHGPAWALLGVFTGGDHLGAALLEGRVRAVADFAALSAFIGVTTRFMLGEQGTQP